MFSLTYVIAKITTPKYNENKYIMGSGVGRKTIFIRRALNRRAAQSSCCKYSGIIPYKNTINKPN